MEERSSTIFVVEDALLIVDEVEDARRAPSALSLF